MKAGRKSKGLGGGGGGGGGGASPADLLVCFPSRAHLALMPKPICSPVRSNSQPNKRHLKTINPRGGRASTVASGRGPASPLFWAKGKQMSGAPEIAEPTSPKVTCAGQIKVRPRSSATATTACRNWQSVMEEIERLHSSRSKHNKKSKHWGEALGFKKDIINFLTCLGNLRFDFRCLGSFPDPDMTSDEDSEDDDEEENDKEEEDDDQCYTRETAAEEVEKGDQHNTVFSKWFMVLQENQHIKSTDTKNSSSDIGKQLHDEKGVPEREEVQVPPPNALLLMRCRSAPATKRSNWVQKREHVMNGTTAEDQENEKYSKEQAEEVREEEEQEKQKAEAEALVAGLQEGVLEQNSTSSSCQEQPKKKKRESLAIVMKYDADFYDLSSNVSQETWLAGNAAFHDTFSRSRSWKR